MMGKYMTGRLPRALASLLTACLLIGAVAGCSSNKAGMASPELPAKHWLDEAPGVPIENKDQYDQALADLYDPTKKFRFSDCVYLTIQQSPALVNSAVDIEIKRLAQTNAAWKYLPEPHLMIKLSQNITNYNQGSKYKSKNYGQPQYEIGLTAPFPNPVATYYENKAQQMLSGVAISTHRKAIGDAIYNIAQAYLKLQARQYSIVARKSLVPLNVEMTDYWKQVEAVSGNQGAAVRIAEQREHEAELNVDKANMEDVMQRTQLKLLAGVEANHKLIIDPTDADKDILGEFNGKKMRWEDEWLHTEDYLLLRTQLKLYDYNIMLQWAQYVPNMNMAVNMSAPRGQSQPRDGNEDYFFHFTFNFPLIDWGRRYRNVQTARMQKAQAFHQIAQKRAEFQNKWMQAEQGVELSLTNLKLAQSRYKTRQMQYEEARIGFENGLEQLPEVASRQENMVNAQISYINAECDYRLALLKWMYISGELQRAYLGLPSREMAKLVDIDPDAPMSPELEDAPDPSALPVFGAPRASEEPIDRSKARPIGRVRLEPLPELPTDAADSADGSKLTPGPLNGTAELPVEGESTARPAAAPAVPASDLTTTPSL